MFPFSEQESLTSEKLMQNTNHPTLNSQAVWFVILVLFDKFLNLTSKMGEKAMAATETFKGRKESYILVTGADGEEYICPKSALKRKSELTEQELKDCVPEGVTGGGASIGG